MWYLSKIYILQLIRKVKITTLKNKNYQNEKFKSSTNERRKNRKTNFRSFGNIANNRIRLLYRCNAFKINLKKLS